MKIQTFALFLILNTALFAREDIGAHVHGAVSMDLATDKNQILVMLNSPAESFLGFEYKAKSSKEKSFVKKVKKEWSNVIQFLGEHLKDCQVSKSQWNQKFSGKNHSSITAEAYIDCKKPTAGRELSVSLKKHYNRIQSVKVQLLREDGSTLNKRYKDQVFEIKI